jgi:hypothetical protein
VPFHAGDGDTGGPPSLLHAYHIRYLSSLSISVQHKDFLKPVKYLIDSGELIRNYAINFIN